LLDLFLIGGWSEPFSVFLLSCGREVFHDEKVPTTPGFHGFPGIA
jgi:hypothetical protein